MADNATLPAIGTVVGADEISSVKYQRIKLIHGTDGTNDGDVASTNPLPVTVSSGHTSTITITRPSDTTAYAAGDAIGDTTGSAIITFANMGKAGGNVLINGVNLRIDNTSIPSGMVGFTLELYSAAPDAIADNAVWNITSSGDKSKYLGYLALNAMVDKGSVLFSQTDGLNCQVPLTTTSLYGVLRTDTVYTPDSATPYVISLKTMEL